MYKFRLLLIQSKIFILIVIVLLSGCFGDPVKKEDVIGCYLSNNDKYYKLCIDNNGIYQIFRSNNLLRKGEWQLSYIDGSLYIEFLNFTFPKNTNVPSHGERETWWPVQPMRKQGTIRLIIDIDEDKYLYKEFR